MLPSPSVGSLPSVALPASLSRCLSGTFQIWAQCGAAGHRNPFFFFFRNSIPMRWVVGVWESGIRAWGPPKNSRRLLRSLGRTGQRVVQGRFPHRLEVLELFLSSTELPVENIMSHPLLSLSACPSLHSDPLLAQPSPTSIPFALKKIPLCSSSKSSNGSFLSFI